MMNGKSKVYRQGSHRVVIRESEEQVDVYITGKGEKTHCHIWVDKNKREIGEKHRGECDKCNPNLPTENL